MTRDPLVRRNALWRRSNGRVVRRSNAMVAYIDAHPLWTRATDPRMARLDDLVGEADRLRARL